MDPRLDVKRFVRDKTAAFEQHLRDWLSERVRLEAPTTYVEVGKAMKRGVPVLWHPQLVAEATATPTCLVRCDVLDELMYTPTLLAPDHTVCGPPHCPTHLLACELHAETWDCPRKTCKHAVPTAEWTLAQWPKQTHYRVVVAKYAQLELLRDGRSLGNSAAMNMHRLKVLHFNTQLGVLQRFRPPVAYLLGRRTKSGGEVELSCVARAAEVFHHTKLPPERDEPPIETLPGPRADLPTQLDLVLPAWDAVPVEYVVDFETVSNLDDDFAAFPVSGGCPMIFMIGCARLERGKWVAFHQWTVATLSLEEEARILGAWLASLQPGAPVLHWARAEQVMYAAARKRHPTADWPPTLAWRDATDLYKELPLDLPNVKLKHVCAALAPVLETTWDTEGPSNGESAMVAAWWCHANAEAFATHPLMQSVAHYNWTDCRTVFELVRWARTLLAA
jgi:hypothetical protein